jgi:hypothetical protein
MLNLSAVTGKNRRHANCHPRVMHWRHPWRVAVLVHALVILPSAAFAQVDQPPSPQPPQIDQMVINVPTTLSLPSHHSDFRLTHRFARDLRCGSFEGTNNMQQDYQPGVTATVSRTHDEWLALYASPSYVQHAHTTTVLELHGWHQHDNFSTTRA